MLSSSILSKFQDIIGIENLLTDKEDLLTYAYDGTPLLRQKPLAVLIARNTSQISEIMKICNTEKIPVVPRGSGTGLSGGSVPLPGSVVLLLNQMNKILEIDSENMTAWVETGVITADLHEQVEKIGLFYPPDPSSMKISTLGGNVAENSGGLRGLKYGVTKNYVIGLELILPNGDILNIGNKCAKDVAGYNLKDIIIGSEGTLAIISKILLKLIPLPESKKSMLVYYKTLDSAAKTVSAIIAAHIIPATLELLDHITIECVENYAHIGLPSDMAALLFIELDGPKSVVDNDADKIIGICKQYNADKVQLAKNNDEALEFASARRNVFPALASVKPTTILEDATVPRNQIAPMLREIHRIAQKYNLQIGTFGHAGDGNLHPTCLIDERNNDELIRAEHAFEEIFEIAIKLGGTITGEHGVGLAKKKFLPKQLNPAGIGFMQSIKSILDPLGILNPGKIFDFKPR